jgi:hypothetical protein
MVGYLWLGLSLTLFGVRSLLCAAVKLAVRTIATRVLPALSHMRKSDPPGMQYTHAVPRRPGRKVMFRNRGRNPLPEIIGPINEYFENIEKKKQKSLNENKKLCCSREQYILENDHNQIIPVCFTEPTDRPPPWVFALLQSVRRFAIPE